MMILVEGTWLLMAAQASMPETRDVLADVDRVSKAAAEASAVATQLPDFLAREREAAIKQFMGELQSQQEQTLALVTELRKALEAGTATSDSLQGTLRSFDTLMVRFQKPPGAPPPATPSRPFDITEYATAARELAATAKQLEILVVQLEAGAPGLGQVAQQTTRELGISITAYSVLGRGLISATPPVIGSDDWRGHTPRFQGDNLTQNLALVRKLDEIAENKGVTVAQLAIAWVAARGEDVVPLVGTTKRARLNEAIGAVDVTFTERELQDIEAVVPDGAVAGTRYAAAQMAMLDSER